MGRTGFIYDMDDFSPDQRTVNSLQWNSNVNCKLQLITVVKKLREEIGGSSAIKTEITFRLESTKEGFSDLRFRLRKARKMRE